MALSLISGRYLPLPGICVSCGSGGIDMIDTGKNEQIYGAVLICIVCFRDGATRIPELNLFPKDVHEDMIEELEEKIIWRDSLEPTVARLEADIRSALDTARHGFSQRYITNGDSNEVLQATGQYDSVGREVSGGNEQGTEQLFFTIGELQKLGLPDGDLAQYKR